jgi:isopenicillin-N epimerase
MEHLMMGSLPPFGRSMRHLWALAEDATFLNHGSFGACPKEVLAEQQRIRNEMESQPDVFFRRSVMPDTDATALRAAASELAAFVNAGDGHVAFVENATAGIQAVLRSVELGVGDRVLITEHTYNAVRLMVEARCAESGATPLVVRIPIPTDADDVVGRFAAAIVPSVKLAIVDHITSPTALVLPLERILAELRRFDARVIVDGAHAVGQVPLDLAALGADWYVSNAHKWLFAPKGTAFLYASKEASAITRPNVVSHFIDMGFPRSFDWTGTRDVSAWLATPAALKFFTALDAATVRAYQARLVEICSELLSSIGARPVAPIGMCAAMRSFLLPQRRPATAQDALEIVRMLWDGERIQSMAVRFADDLLVRVSTQVYVDEDDVRRLSEALDRRGWPGR